jgi:prenyltransferase beta subunit
MLLVLSGILYLFFFALPLQAADAANESPPDRKLLDARIASMASENFDTRQDAFNELSQYGFTAYEALDAAKSSSDLELRLRVQELLLLSTKSSLQAGLAWLARNQAADGRWKSSNSVIHGSRDLEHTAIVVLAFLGNTPPGDDDPFKPVVDKALDWIIQQQGEDGDFPGDAQTHAWASIALCTALKKANRWPSNIRQPAQRATNYTCKIYHPTIAKGTSGFAIDASKDADLRTTALTLWHLCTAKAAGLHLDDSSFEGCRAFLKSVMVKPDHVFLSAKDGTVDSNSIAQGIWCLSYNSKTITGPAIDKSFKQLLQRYSPGCEGGCDLLTNLLVSQCLDFVGGDSRNNWIATLRKSLISHQSKAGDSKGSWTPLKDDRLNSVAAATALNLLTLQCVTHNKFR